MSNDSDDDPATPTTSRRGRRGSLKVRRLPVTFTSDVRRVITRYFDPGGEARIRHLIERIINSKDSNSTMGSRRQAECGV